MIFMAEIALWYATYLLFIVDKIKRIMVKNVFVPTAYLAYTQHSNESHETQWLWNDCVLIKILRISPTY